MPLEFDLNQEEVSSAGGSLNSLCVLLELSHPDDYLTYPVTAKLRVWASLNPVCNLL
jgi:hypothetical protein